MKLEWRNVSVVVPHGKGTRKVLNSVCGSAESGNLMALMGPSGCGKTTLLNVLRGYVPYEYTTNGEVLLDGKALSPREMASMSFLDQDDFYLDYYGVYEFLEFCAIGRNRGLSRAEIKKQIDELLTRLFLKEKRDMRISKLSGGERRRLMIANELLGNTEIVFLDEPTTGLDSHLALELVYFLSEMAREQNKLIITTIHQPSARILSVFHDFAFINEGKMIYCGAYEDCKDFFAERGFSRRADTNIAEHLFLLGANEKTLISDAKRDIPLFRRYLEEIPDVPFVAENSEASVPFTQGACSLVAHAIPVCVKRQLKSCTKKGRALQLVSKFATLVLFALVFTLSLALSGIYAEAFDAYPSLWFDLIAGGFLTFFSCSLADLPFNRMEIRRSYFTFSEWLVSVFAFLTPFFVIVSAVFFAPLLYVDFTRFFLRCLLYTVGLLPFAFVQGLFISSIAPYEFLSILLHTALTFSRALPNFLLRYEAYRKCGERVKSAVRYAVLCAQLFPVNFFKNCVEHLKHADKNGKAQAVEGIKFSHYVILSVLLFIGLLCATFFVLKRTLSTPMRPRLEKKREDEKATHSSAQRKDFEAHKIFTPRTEE